MQCRSHPLEKRASSSTWKRRWCLRCAVEPKEHEETHLHCHDDGMVDTIDKLWPYGPPEVHQRACILFQPYRPGVFKNDVRFCDCAASAQGNDGEDADWGQKA